jgi:hypothetical protein
MRTYHGPAEAGHYVRSVTIRLKPNTTYELHGPAEAGHYVRSVTVRLKPDTTFEPPRSG